MRIIPILSARKSGIFKSTRNVITFNRTLDTLETHYIPIAPNPKILEIARHTPFSYREVEEIYNLSQERNIPLESLIFVACQLGGNQIAVNLIKERLKDDSYRLESRP